MLNIASIEFLTEFDKVEIVFFKFSLLNWFLFASLVPKLEWRIRSIASLHVCERRVLTRAKSLRKRAFILTWASHRRTSAFSDAAASKSTNIALRQATRNLHGSQIHEGSLRER